MSAAVASIDRLRVAHLPEITPIERASYPTPWSVAMFVLELTRAEGIALGARGPAEGDEPGPLLGYIICSPQADEWHVMNVTVSPEHRNRGIARALLRELHAVLAGATAGRARLTLEVRPSNDPPSRSTSPRATSWPDGAAATTPTTARTRS